MVSGSRLRQPPGRPAVDAGRGLPPHRGHHGQGPGVHRRCEGGRPGEAILPLLRTGGLPCAAPRPQGVDREVQGSLRQGLRGDAGTDAGAAEEARARPERHGAAADQPDRDARHPHGTRRQAVPPARRHTALGFAQRRREEAVCPHGGGIRRLSRARRPPHRSAARLSRAERGAREHADRGRLGQRCERRGRPERLGQRDEVRQRRPGRPRAEPGDDRRAWRHEDLQPLREWVGDGVQHPVQDVEAVRVQRGDERPMHHLLARRHEGARRDPRPVPPRHRHRAHDPGRARRRGAGDDQGPHADAVRRRQHARQL